MIENILQTNYANQMWTISGSIANENDWDQNVFWAAENTIPKPEWSEVEPLLNEYKISNTKTRKLAELNDKCTEAIRAGFVSDALGSNHWYSTAKDEDQVNLVGASVLADTTGNSVYYACREGDKNGAKAMKTHNQNQMKQVLAQGSAIKLQLLQKYYAKIEAVNNAQTIEEIEAITW